MKMYSVVKFLSSETKVSSKGNSYRISTFMQDGTADILMCIDKTDLNLDFGEDINAIFDFDTRFQKLSFIGIQ